MDQTLRPHPEAFFKVDRFTSSMFQVSNIQSEEKCEYDLWRGLVAEAVFVRGDVLSTPLTKAIVSSIKRRQQGEIYDLWKQFSGERNQARTKRFKQWGAIKRAGFLMALLICQEQELASRSYMYGLEWTEGYQITVGVNEIDTTRPM